VTETVSVKEITSAGRRRFSAFAQAVTTAAGSGVTAAVAALLVGGWIWYGARTGFPRHWETVIVISLAVVSLFMLFLIQHTTNRQTHAALLKLDELVGATHGARDEVIDVESRDPDEQEQVAEDVREQRRPAGDGAPGTESSANPAGGRSGGGGPNGVVPPRRLRTLADLTELVSGRPGLYIRYSEGPEADRDRPSRDYESGQALPGLSVTPLDAQAWWTRPLADWLARQVCKYVELAEHDQRRYPWVLSGREIGRGPDHEPLVVDFSAVAVLDDQVVEEASRRYQERFDVGRTSTGQRAGS
jgi:low affinity Fe/Cu permease